MALPSTSMQAATDEAQASGPSKGPKAIGLLSLPDDLLLCCLGHLSQQER